jgi:hypothetical protein
MKNSPTPPSPPFRIDSEDTHHEKYSYFPLDKTPESC